MSAHDSHAPVHQTKGIWALPLTAWIIVLILLVAFTRPIFVHAPEGSGHHEAEKPHSKAEEAESSHH